MHIFTKITRFAPPVPLSCEEINRFIVDFLDGDMDEALRSTFGNHLRHCSNCAAFLDQYRHTIRLLRAARDVPIPEELVRRTIDVLRNHYDDV